MLCEDISGESGGVIYFNNFVNAGLAEQNIFKKCKKGIFLHNNSKTNIKNSYFISCDEAIYLYNNCISEVIHNEITNSKNGISFTGSNAIIEYNNITGIICITIPYGPYTDSSTGEIHENNLYGMQFAIKITGTQYDPNVYDIPAEQDYFGTLDYEEIENLIYDKNDIPEDSPHYPYVGNILWEPPANSEILAAGIEKF